jgi:hypothetical protein
VTATEFPGAWCSPWLPKVLVHQFLEVAQHPDGAVIVERQHLHHLDGTDGQLRKIGAPTCFA